MSNEHKSGGGTRDEAPAKNPPVPLGPVELHTSVKKSDMKDALEKFADNLKKIAAEVNLTTKKSYDITLVFHGSHHKTSIHFHCNNGDGSDG